MNEDERQISDAIHYIIVFTSVISKYNSVQYEDDFFFFFALFWSTFQAFGRGVSCWLKMLFFSVLFSFWLNFFFFYSDRRAAKRSSCKPILITVSKLFKEIRKKANVDVYTSFSFKKAGQAAQVCKPFQCRLSQKNGLFL